MLDDTNRSELPEKKKRDRVETDPLASADMLAVLGRLAHEDEEEPSHFRKSRDS